MAIISKTSVVMKQIKNFGTLDVMKLLSEELEYNEDEIVELNREQMRRSETKEGLMSEYLDPEKKDTSSYYGKWPHYDLYDTGDFQNDMFMKIKGNELFINSDDPKTGSILKLLDYGMDDPYNVFEFNDKNLKIASDIVTPGLFKRVHNAINK